MTQTIQASEITLNDLREKFNLHRAEDDQFFTEWREDLPKLTDLEKLLMDRVKSNYLDQLEFLPLEEEVKMVVLSPLLDQAGFYRRPFRLKCETPIQIAVEDEDKDEVIQGRIDALIVQGQLWVVAIEAKRTRFSLEVAIPQALAYMLSNSNLNKPTLAMVTNGGDFRFIKLVKQDPCEYDLSNIFSILNRGNDLYGVLQVLKRIGALIQ